jgi:hypothetical protein
VLVPEAVLAPEAVLVGLVIVGFVAVPVSVAGDVGFVLIGLVAVLVTVFVDEAVLGSRHSVQTGQMDTVVNGG